MPPRKKAAAANASATPQPRATRSSTRAKAPASTASAASTAAKGKGKRARDASEDEDKDDKDEPDNKKAKTDANDAPPVLPVKMTTVLMRGPAPVDPSSGLANTHHVLSTPEGVWDATLNQTDVVKNANKFYVLQVLYPSLSPQSCIMFTRWGRVGERGQQQQKGPFSPSVAVEEFKRQFKAKAGVSWGQRHGMVAKKGKYQWIERAFEEEKENSSKTDAGPSKTQEPEKVPDSTLATEIQALCNLIFSARLIEAHLSSMNYDANKLPLGKLAKSTILGGFAALKTLSEVIEHPDGDTAKQFGGFRSAVEELTGRYYSIIPHVFGRTRPTIIDNPALLKWELDLVDALGDMEVTSKLIEASVPKDDQGQAINPLDANFLSLRLSSMDPISRDCKEFSALEAYARDTHGATHQHYQVQIQNAFRVERQDETDAWLKAGYDKLADGERLLLWHGSRTTNFAGILKQGLRIAPPEAPVTGYMFGKGVYFADMMSKSANYCHSHLSDHTGLLLLCEVAAKPFYEQTNANCYADEESRKAEKLCTKGVGRMQPAEWQDAGAALDNDALQGCHMPKGPGEPSMPSANLMYNEYIVYDTAQIRLRYLLMIKMT